MDGSYNLTTNFYLQGEHRASEEDLLSEISGEDVYRNVEHNHQCCDEPLHRRLRSRGLRPLFPQLQPVNINISRSPSTSTVVSNTSLSMERTPSGNSILPGSALSVSSKDTNTLSDAEAASEMIKSFRRRRRHLLEERVLESLIRSGAKLDNEALHSVLRATDKVFFQGRLAGRVRWEWSHPDSTRYEHELIGTTALRKAKDRPGYETLIILSRPMLWSGKYNHRLLLSTFLHEAVHCYLFIRCGFKAMRDGGHTNGFREIAKVIDRWAGGLLQLRNTKADLNSFSVERVTSTRTSSSILDSTISSTTLDFQPHPPSEVDRPSALAKQRLPRNDRARYRRVAQMSQIQDLLDGDGSATPRQGWSTFVAFAGGC